jgi:hypothetical protein
MTRGGIFYQSDTDRTNNFDSSALIPVCIERLLELTSGRVSIRLAISPFSVCSSLFPARLGLDMDVCEKRYTSPFLETYSQELRVW